MKIILKLIWLQNRLLDFQVKLVQRHIEAQKD